MQRINITLTEQELVTLLDVLDQALEDESNDTKTIAKLFDRLSEVAYDTQFDE